MNKLFKNKKLIFSFLLWLFSIALFDFILFFKKNNTEWSTLEFVFFLQSIGVGTISFIVFILTLEKFFHKKYLDIKARIFSSLSLIFSLVFGIGLIIFPFLILSNYKPKEIVKQTKASKNTLISLPLKIGSTGEEVKILQSALATNKSIYPSGLVSGYYGDLTRQAVINFQKQYNLPQTGEIDQQTADKFNEVYGDKTRDYYLNTNTVSNQNTNNQSNNNVKNNIVDLDPLVNCSIHVNCGGGTRQLRKSICDQSTCCQIGNTWLFYESKTKCTQDQGNYNNQAKTNYTYPTYAPLPTFDLSTHTAPTYYPCTLYYPTLNYSRTYNSLYRTKEKCDAAQLDLNKGLSIIQYPTPTSYVPKIIKSQCQANVNDKYQSLMINYGCSYPCPSSGDCGSSSVCVILWKKAQEEMNLCNQYLN